MNTLLQPVFEPVDGAPERETILVVDDNSTNLRFLQEILKSDYKVYAAPSGERALAFLEKKIIPDLILLDVEMPGLNGYEVISRLKSDARWSEIPVIFLTAQEGREKEQQAFTLGAVDYILKPISYGVVRSRVKLHMELEMYKKRLEHMVEVKTSQLLKTQDSILDMLSNITAYRDNETGAHIKRTTFYVELIVRRIIEMRRSDYEISSEYALNIGKSSKLHDIGKVGVPDRILLKPDRLTPEEFDIIKQHASLGAQILDDAINDLGDSSPFLFTAREITVAHHEKWDGKGYPCGLKGEEIPISARIMAIADVYDALISRRPYKEPFTHEEAMKIILDSSGTHFDPNIIEMCMPIFDQFPMISERYKDEHYQKKMLT
jgi:putative two-component system response regulator